MGIIVITVLSFVMPDEPFKIIPALPTPFSFDKPLFVCYLFGGSALYLIILYAIYDKLKQRKIA